MIQLVSVAAGLWLMAAPAVLTYEGAAATNDRILGPTIAALAFIALWEVVRGLRLVNVPLALWLIVAPFVLGYDATATINSVVTGGVVLAVSPLGGRTKQSYANGWRGLLQRA